MFTQLLALVSPMRASWRLRLTLTGHERGLSAVVTTRDAEGRAVAVTGGHAERTVRVWDLATGTQTALLRPSEEDAWALAATTLGRPCVVTGSYHGVIQVWDVAGGAPTGRVEGCGGDLVCSLATAVLAGRPVLVSTAATDDGDPDTYRAWPDLTVSDLATGRVLHTIATEHTGAVRVATAVLAGRPVVVSSGSTDPTLHVWDLATGAPVGAPVGGRPAGVLAGQVRGTAAHTTADLAGRPVVIAAGDDGAVRRWDLASGAPLGAPLTGVAARLVAVVDLAGHPAVVAAATDMVCAWDLATGAVLVPPFVARGIGALATSTVDGVPVAVTAMRDGTVHVWDLTPAPVPVAPVPAVAVPAVAVPAVAVPAVAVPAAGGPAAGAGQGQAGRAAPRGHTGAVTAVATATVDGRRVAVSVGQDRVVHRWDLSAPTPEQAHLEQLPAAFTSLAVSDHGGRARFVGVGGTDVWSWEPGSTPTRLATLQGRRLWSVAATVLDGRPVAVVGGDDGAWHGELRILDLPTGPPLLNPSPDPSPGASAAGSSGGFAAGLPGGGLAVGGVGGGSTVGLGGGRVVGGHDAFVASVATAVVDGRAVAVAAGATESVVRVWDLASGRQRVLRGHRGWVRAVATVEFAGRAHAITADVDGVVRQWDLRSGEERGPALTGHVGGVHAVATAVTGGEWPVAVTGGEDRTVRLWDLTTGEQIGPAWECAEPVTAVAVAVGCVVAGSGFDVVVLGARVLRFAGR